MYMYVQVTEKSDSIQRTTSTCVCAVTNRLLWAN